MTRALIITGVILIVAGTCRLWLQHFPLGRLPGDVIMHLGGYRFYIPVTSSIVISLVLTVVVWLLKGGK